MQDISGYVDHIIYQNEDNGYTVFVLNPEDEDYIRDDEGTLTCVGQFFDLNSGENIRLTGDFVTHRSYGEQFSVSSYEILMPQDSEAVLRYLSSGAIRGIGPALAKKIVEKFGSDTFSIMESNPDKLSSIRGISRKKAIDISEQIVDQRDRRGAMMLLSSYGIGTTLSMKIYKQYGSSLYDILKENPYQLAEEVDGVGFRTADAIAFKNGFSVDSHFRIESGILYVLGQMAGNGHTYVPRDELTEYVSQLLGIDAADVAPLYADMAISHKIRSRQDEVYLPLYYKAEAGTAKLLTALDEEYYADIDKITKVITNAEREEGWNLDPVQKKAIFEAVAHGVIVLTGGPGTGKTTTIRTILRYFSEEGMDISLCAPTGRAAKRMSEATGFPASTIHRLLGIGRDSDSEDDKPHSRNQEHFTYNSSHPLESDVIIVDEMSMVDIMLMYSLVKAVPVGARLILVGDANQLPSVGPGNVLKDIIRSKAFSVVTLERIFRQGSKSDIVENAHGIHRGEHVPISNNSHDFFFAKSNDADKIIAKVCSYLSKNSLPAYVHSDVFDIQVLTPTRKGNLGVERLNTILQKRINPPAPDKKEYESGNRLFREGDKVMQIKNNYDITWEIYGKYGITIEQGEGVFNGDMGIITSIDTFSRELTITFDDSRVVRYPLGQLEEVELAYAVTIHKSQGSEYPAVIIPLLPGPRLLYNRNLLYTAVTRAKKCVVIIGDDNTFFSMIDNASENKRYSGLQQRIEELI